MFAFIVVLFCLAFFLSIFFACFLPYFTFFFYLPLSVCLTDYLFLRTFIYYLSSFTFKGNSLTSLFVTLVFTGFEQQMYSSSGLYAAAHKLDIEWIVIKGVSDFADGNKSDTNAWRPFASVMAASVVAHILKDVSVFQNWPHYKSKSKVYLAKLF